MRPLQKALAWLAAQDAALSRRIALPADREGSPLRRAAQVGAHLGDSVVWVGVTGLLWWRRREDPAATRALGGWAASFVAGLLSVLLLKRLFRRERPGTGHFLYGPGADQHSFPSGHGARAGVILVWSGLLLGRWRWLAPFMALWIGWSRVALTIHYLGDVLVGFGLGLALARWIKRFTKHPETGK